MGTELQQLESWIERICKKNKTPTLNDIKERINLLKNMEELEVTLLNAVWLMRWNEEKTVMKAVLTEEEATQMCKDIVEELDKAGYKIVPKDNAR